MESKMQMPFLDQSESFVFGFEAGQIWTRMEIGFKFEDYLIHNENKDQIEMICRRFNYSFIVHRVSSEWSYLTAEINN